MKKRSLLVPILSLALVGAGVWLYFTPYLALRELQEAAEAGDTRALSEHVDFPSLRESVKQELRGVVERGIDRERRNPLSSLGGMLAGALAGSLVDAVVTPSGIAALTRGERPGASDSEESGESDAETGRDGPMDGIDVARGYEGWGRFAIHYRDRESGEDRVTLLLRREGLAGWRLYAVRLGGDDPAR